MSGLDEKEVPVSGSGFPKRQLLEFSMKQKNWLKYPEDLFGSETPDSLRDKSSTNLIESSGILRFQCFDTGTEFREVLKTYMWRSWAFLMCLCFRYQGFCLEL